MSQTKLQASKSIDYCSRCQDGAPLSCLDDGRWVSGVWERTAKADCHSGDQRAEEGLQFTNAERVKPEERESVQASDERTHPQGNAEQYLEGNRRTHHLMDDAIRTSHPE